MTIANCSSASIISYVRGVQKLILHHNKCPEDCSVHEIKSYLVYCKNELNYSASTLNLRVCSLKYYFREVANRLDLVVSIPNPRRTRYDAEILNYEELIKLFQSSRDIRQKLVVTLFYETGMRVSEMARVRLCDFDKTHRTITVYNSKGRKTRVVYYGAILRKVLKQYIAVLGYYPKGNLIESYSQPGEAISKRGIQHIVNEVAKRSGLTKKISPHILRHTFAVHYLNRGGSLFRLQKLLGHSYLSTTLHYLKFAIIPESSDLSVLDSLI